MKSPAPFLEMAHIHFGCMHIYLIQVFLHNFLYLYAIYDAEMYMMVKKN